MSMTEHPVAQRQRARHAGAAPRPAADRGPRPAPGRLGHRAAGAARLVRRPRPGRVPGPPGGRPRLVRPRDVVRRDPHAAGGAARGPGDPFPLRHARRDRDARGRRRAHDEGAPRPRRWPRRRVGPHALPGARPASGANDAVHLEPGRLRGRVPVLRDRRARPLARPLDRRDRRPGALLAPRARGGGSAPDEHRLHGHGRAAPQPRRGRRRLRGALRQAALRPRAAAHHGQHERRRAGHRALHDARAPVHARGLAPRCAAGAPGRPRAAQPALSDRRRRRGRDRLWRARPAVASRTRW